MKKETKINTRSGKMIDNTSREAETIGSVCPIVKLLGMMLQAHLNSIVLMLKTQKNISLYVRL